jgi:hypothetical protein
LLVYIPTIAFIASSPSAVHHHFLEPEILLSTRQLPTCFTAAMRYWPG